MRAALNASQALFARLLNVSSNAVESWEQGIRQPRQATLKLLHIVRKDPECAAPLTPHRESSGAVNSLETIAKKNSRSWLAAAVK